MSNQNETLFDLEPYGGETPRQRAAAARATTLELQRSSAPPVEPHLEPWILMRDRQGVLPYFHLVRARMNTGASVTACGKMGTTITNLGVSQMIRCPECDIAVQVQDVAVL